MTSHALNEHYGIPGEVQFIAGEGGFTKAVISNRHAAAEVYLHGATVTAFQPRGKAPVLWLSPQAVFKPGKAIRGGIPVCWPWFGPHPTDSTKPQHGFARTAQWSVVSTATLPDDSTELRLHLSDDAQTRSIWPHSFRLELAVVIGSSLRVALRTQNTGNDPMKVGCALHSYFHVGDIHRVEINGLDGRDYVDQPDGNRIKHQTGPVKIEQEVDRIYLDTEDECVIQDTALARSIRVAKSGSKSTVVWNPWIAKSKALADIPDDGYLGMVCVETTNAAKDARFVAAGASSEVVQIISVE